jgi:5,10-methylenetetrahydromethanopterin reductase
VRLSLTFTGFGALASNLPAVKAAEEAGFDGVWYAEHICMHDAIVPATAFLCATERLEIGVVGLSIAGRHPGVTAMELASLAELGPGRVRAAVGLGVPEMVAKLGKKITKPIAETTQLVQSLRQALAGLDLNFERPGYKFEQYKLNPMGPPPPIDVMAVRPRMQETAAVIGDGISLSIGGSHSYIADVVQRCEEVLAREGRSRQDFRVTAVVAAAVTDNIEAGCMQVAGILSSFDPGTIGYLAQGALPDGALEEAFARGGPFEAVSLFTEEVVQELAIVAPPDGLGPALKRYADLGVDDLAIVPLNPPPQIPEILPYFTAARP